MIRRNAKLTQRAQELRKNATPEERHLWYDFLKDHPTPFRRQYVIESYIVDFYCPSAKLAIELDGVQHGTDAALEYDKERSAFLQSFGIDVLRFQNSEIRKNFDAVCACINHTVVVRQAAH